MNAKTGIVDSTLESDSSKNNAHQHGAITLASGKDKLRLDLNTVIDDAQALLREVVDSSSEQIAGAPAYMKDRLSKVKCNLDRARSAVENKARHATAVTDEYVHENPWKSMGFATAASVLFGYLLFRAWVPASGKAEKE